MRNPTTTPAQHVSRRNRRIVGVAIVVGSLVAASCSSDSAGSPTGSSTATTTAITDVATTTAGDTGSSAPGGDTGPTWHTCTGSFPTSDPKMSCARIEVPLDYQQPDSDTIGISMIRIAATDEPRLGAVLFNPGGPGASGIDIIGQAGSVIQQSMGLTGFDLIGFDPRGVEQSDRLRCLSNEDLDASMYLDSTPDSPEAQAALDNADNLFADRCVAKYGDTLRHYSTANTARDMDAIRVALGDDQLSFLGISYGTYLGAVYATMFPDRVRAMVLDSAYDPVGDSIDEQVTTQLVGFEGALDNWIAWCQQETSCSFHSDQVGADYDALFAAVDAEPIPNSDGRMANQSVMMVATIASLYSETSWPILADALSTAAAGDPTGLFALADEYNGRGSDGSYSAESQARHIISCASGFEQGVPESPDELVERIRTLAPRFGQSVTADDFTDDCVQLVADHEPAVMVDYAGDGPIVVIGGTNDPATPIRWATKMVGELGPNARLVTYTGEGHGQLLNSQCVTLIEAALLATLELPDEGTVCDPDPEVPEPSWWTDVGVPQGIGPVLDSPELSALLGIGPTLAFGELRQSTMSTDVILDRYSKLLTAARFEVGPRQQPIEGMDQVIFFPAGSSDQPDGPQVVLSVSVIDRASFDTATYAGVADLVNPDQQLVLIFAVPVG